MSTIIFYFLVAAVVIGMVILAVPAEKSASSQPEFSPRDILLQVKQ